MCVAWGFSYLACPACRVKGRFEDYLQEWGRGGCRQSAGASISGESRGWEFTVCAVADHGALGPSVLGHSHCPPWPPFRCLSYDMWGDCENGGHSSRQVDLEEPIRAWMPSYLTSSSSSLYPVCACPQGQGNHVGFDICVRPCYLCESSCYGDRQIS